MKFIIDQCAGRRIAQWLAREGHDVREVRTIIPDPGDRTILELAAREGRVVITRDKGFGRLVHQEQQPHAGVVQLPNVSAERRIEMVRQVLDENRNDLRDRAMIAVDWGAGSWWTTGGSRRSPGDGSGWRSGPPGSVSASGSTSWPSAWASRPST